LRILLVNYTETLEPGGINKVVREIAYHASMRGHQVVVFNPARTKAEECNVTVINSNCKIIRGYKGYIFGLNPRNISLLVKIIRQFSPHIIHVHEYHSLLPTITIIALKEIYKVKIPIVFSPHLDIERSSLAARALVHNPFSPGSELFKPHQKAQGTDIPIDMRGARAIHSFGIL